jgi:integrase
MLEQIADGLGRRAKVADIHSGHIQKLHKQITVNSGPVRANRVLAIASKAFSLALKKRDEESEPWRTAEKGNPCKGVERNDEGDGCERFFSVEEIAALADALDLADERSSADCVRLIMLTGCRPCEAMAARWSEFDAGGFWEKPSAHTKQRKVHKAPLGADARALIEGLRERRGDSPFLFPSAQNRGEPIRHVRTVWRTARRRATLLLWTNSPNPAVSALVADLARQLGRQPTVEEIEGAASIAKITLPASLATARVYDLRHTFASLGAASNMSHPVIGKLLGHTQVKTTERYMHLGDSTAREAVETIGGMIGKAIANARRRKASMAG